MIPDIHYKFSSIYFEEGMPANAALRKYMHHI